MDDLNAKRKVPWAVVAAPMCSANRNDRAQAARDNLDWI